MPFRSFIFTFVVLSWSDGATSSDRWTSRQVISAVEALDFKLTERFQGIIMFLQSLPTEGWGDEEIEMLLSQSFVLSSTWANAQNHFS